MVLLNCLEDLFVHVVGDHCLLEGCCVCMCERERVDSELKHMHLRINCTVAQTKVPLKEREVQPSVNRSVIKEKELQAFWNEYSKWDVE